MESREALSIMKGISGKYLMVLIAMCGMIATSLGILTNTAGLFFSPIAEDFHVGIGSVSLTLTICNLVYAASGMAVPRLVSGRNFKKVVLSGTIVTAAATAGMCAAPNVRLLYLLSAARGMAGGILGTVLVTIIINGWFHASNGLATSIAMACSGLTGAALSPVLSAVIQTAGWRSGYLVSAFIIVAFNLPAILLPFTLTPEESNLPPLGEGGRKQKAEADSGTSMAVSGSLFCMTAAFGILTSFATAFPQHFPELTGSYALPAVTGALMLSVCMASNTAGKVLLGALIDRIGSKKSLLLYSTLVMLSLCGMLFLRTSLPLEIAAGLYGLSYGLTIVGGVMVTKDLFGVQNYSGVYPTISMGIAVANAAGSSIIGFLYDASGSYGSTIGLILIMMAAVIVLILWMYRREGHSIRQKR